MRPAILLLAGCPTKPAVAVFEVSESVLVEIGVVEPEDLAPVALELRVAEIVFDGEGADEPVSIAAQVDRTLTPLVRTEPMSLGVPSGPYEDGFLTVALAADEGPALLFVATRGDDLLQIRIDALTLEFPVGALQVEDEVRLRVWLSPDAWGLEGVAGTVDSSSGAVYDDVIEALHRSSVLETLP